MSVYLAALFVVNMSYLCRFYILFLWHNTVRIRGRKV
nr:MAG TPA: hypothetical protein [Bacteriophage sp.]